MKPSELLDQARDEIYQNWCKSAYVDQNGAVCSIGAVERVAMRNMEFEAAATAQQALLGKCQEIYGPGISVQGINDRPDITHQDVLNLFDKAAMGLAEIGE